MFRSILSEDSVSAMDEENNLSITTAHNGEPSMFKTVDASKDNSASTPSTNNNNTISLFGESCRLHRDGSPPPSSGCTPLRPKKKVVRCKPGTCLNSHVLGRLPYDSRILNYTDPTITIPMAPLELTTIDLAAGIEDLPQHIDNERKSAAGGAREELLRSIIDTEHNCRPAKKQFLSKQDDNQNKTLYLDPVTTPIPTIKHDRGNNHSNENTVASLDVGDDCDRDNNTSGMDDDYDDSPIEATLKERQPQNDKDDDDDEKLVVDREFLKRILPDFNPEELDDFIKYIQDHASRVDYPAYNSQDLESLRDVLHDFPEEERKDFIQICRKIVPTEPARSSYRNPDRNGKTYYSAEARAAAVAKYLQTRNGITFVDGAVVIAMMMKIGIVDRHAENIDFDFTDIKFETNRNCRVTRLTIDPYYSNRETDRNIEELATFDLPKDIIRLRFLEDLTIVDLRSISQDIDFALLPNLTNLSLLKCSGFNAPLQMMIPQLTCFCFDSKINQTPFDESLPFNHFEWMTSVLPNLECFDVRNIIYDGMMPLFAGYINKNVCFRDSLKKLTIKPQTTYGAAAVNDTMAEIFSSILPKLVNLRSAVIDIRGSGWLKSIPATKHASGSNSNSNDDDDCNEAKPTLPSRLHTIDISYYDLDSKQSYTRMNNLENPSRPEKEALLKLLETNSGVCNLGGWAYHPDIRYALLINQARQGTQLITKSKCIPSFFLPWILERAYTKSNHISHEAFCTGTRYHDGVYELLRNSIVEVVQH